MLLSLLSLISLSLSSAQTTTTTTTTVITTIKRARHQESLDEIIYDLSVNFLLYVTLIIVFYLVVRFYLEEETSPREEGYSKVSTSEEIADDNQGIELVDKDDDNHDQAQLLDNNNNDNVNKVGSAPSSPQRVKRSGSFLNINEWGEPEGTKEEVIQRVCYCAAGLIITFGIWSIVQERMLTQTYDGVFFEYSYGLVFMNRLGGLFLSWYLMYHFKVEWVNTPLWEYSFPSVANMLSSWSQYEALKYVSFPTQMLAKAFKVVPVMLMGKFLHNKSYESYEYTSAVLVGFGLYLFIDSTEHISLQKNVFGDFLGVKGAECGIVLLILYLFFDSFTGQWQTRMFQINKNISPLQMMLNMNAFSAVFSFITLVHKEELYVSLYFVYEHPHMIIHLIIFCICSTVGQLFIFYTIKTFGAVVFSIIMTIRILFSTILSCLVYSHNITELGLLGIAIVFGAVSYRIKMKTEGKPLIRWRETEESKQVFHEWHEHLDI